MDYRAAPLSPPPFTLALPQDWVAPIVVASPHSGRHYPQDFLEASVLTPAQLRSSEDAYTDLLVADAPQLGLPLIAAQYPRAYVDLNRAANELDPAVIEGIARGPVNPRIASGLGVIARVVANGRAIYHGKLARQEALARLSAIWHPYHRALDDLMGQAVRRFGQAILLDIHSMPRDALDTGPRYSGPRPDIVLGDRYGAAADAAVMDALESALRAQGFVIGKNTPFAGAHVVTTYGQPALARHAIQIEIDRALYMDEARIAPHGDFDEIRARLTGALAQMARQFGAGHLPLAAE